MRGFKKLAAIFMLVPFILGMGSDVAKASTGLHDAVSGGTATEYAFTADENETELVSLNRAFTITGNGWNYTGQGTETTHQEEGLYLDSGANLNVSNLTVGDFYYGIRLTDDDSAKTAPAVNLEDVTLTQNKYGIYINGNRGSVTVNAGKTVETAGDVTISSDESGSYAVFEQVADAVAAGTSVNITGKTVTLAGYKGGINNSYKTRTDINAASVIINSYNGIGIDTDDELLMSGGSEVAQGSGGGVVNITAAGTGDTDGITITTDSGALIAKEGGSRINLFAAKKIDIAADAAEGGIVAARNDGRINLSAEEIKVSVEGNSVALCALGEGSEINLSAAKKIEIIGNGDDGSINIMTRSVSSSGPSDGTVTLSADEINLSNAGRSVYMLGGGTVNINSARSTGTTKITPNQDDGMIAIQILDAGTVNIGGAAAEINSGAYESHVGAYVAVLNAGGMLNFSAGKTILGGAVFGGESVSESAEMGTTNVTAGELIINNNIFGQNELNLSGDAVLNMQTETPVINGVTENDRVTAGTFSASDNASLKLDVNIGADAGAAEVIPESDKIFVNTKATGTITLKDGSINLFGTHTDAQWALDTSKQVQYLDGAGLAASDMLIGNSYAYASGGYGYTFSQAQEGGSDKIGFMDIKKGVIVYTLPEIIQGSTADAGKYDDYTLSANETTADDTPLGTLNNTYRASGNKEFTINGAGYALTGANDSATGAALQDNGVTVNADDTLNIKNITMKNFDVAATVNTGGILTMDKVTFEGTAGDADVINDGTLSMGEVAFDKGVKGKGVLNLNNSFVNETAIEQGTINVMNGVVLDNKGTITADVVNKGTITTDAGNISGSVENSNLLTFTGGTFAKNYTSTGTTNFKGKTTFNGAVSLANSTVSFYLDGFKAGDTIVTSDKAVALEGAEIELYQITDTDHKLTKDGDKITLVSKVEGYGYTEDDPNFVDVQGGLVEDTYGVYQSADGALEAAFLESGIIDETKSFSEARLAGSAAINSASDLVAGQAIDSAASGDTWQAFAAIGGSHGRYNTSSHVDLNSLNVAAGLSKKVKDNVTLGIFVEGGNGRYTTYNEFEEGDVRADGDINYFGGGVFAKVEGKKTAKGQLHGEASFRAGHTTSDYNSENFDEDETIRFDTSNAYLGAHIGVGYKWNVKDGSNVDTYVKYLWNRQNSDSPTIAGEKFELDAINSHRLRMGFRYNSKENDKGIKFYGGLAYEYEFDGVAKGHMGEYALLEPDYKGGSGIAEIGLKYDKANNPWKVELGLTGATGKRDSIGVNLGATYEFGK